MSGKEEEEDYIWVEIEQIDLARSCSTGSQGVERSMYTPEQRGELYRALLAEYGRCIGKVYIDGKDGKSRQIGWAFVKREKYSDCEKTFLQETWVTLHKGPPERTTKYNYL